MKKNKEKIVMAKMERYIFPGSYRGYTYFTAALESGYPYHIYAPSGELVAKTHKPPREVIDAILSKLESPQGE